MVLKVYQKNIIKINNKPLIYYTINIAKKSKYLDDYVLNSDDKKFDKLQVVLVLKLWIDKEICT